MGVGFETDQAPEDEFEEVAEEAAVAAVLTLLADDDDDTDDAPALDEPTDDACCMAECAPRKAVRKFAKNGRFVDMAKKNFFLPKVDNRALHFNGNPRKGVWRFRRHKRTEEKKPPRFPGIEAFVASLSKRMERTEPVGFLCGALSAIVEIHSVTAE